MKERNEFLEVRKIEFDKENPRIKTALQKYGDKLDAKHKRIHFALRSATDGASKVSSYKSLRDSIRASNGVQYPITVVTNDDGNYTCIDGNTRLAIYMQFLSEETPGNWSKIKAVIVKPESQRDIETIRVTAHLIGARDWPAYEKARYLHHLRNEKFMDYEDMIALCGGRGNKTNIEQQIDAYHDMNEHYREKVEDAKFHIDRFSGFVELQKSNIKESIYDAGLDIGDFGEWIRDGKISRLESVRALPRVLGDDEARQVFLKGGFNSIGDAKKLLDRKAEIDNGGANKKAKLTEASLHQLATVILDRIENMPYAELKILRDRENKESVAQVNVLEDLSARLQEIIKDVAE